MIRVCFVAALCLLGACTNGHLNQSSAADDEKFWRGLAILGGAGAAAAPSNTSVYYLNGQRVTCVQSGSVTNCQ